MPIFFERADFIIPGPKVKSFNISFNFEGTRIAYLFSSLDLQSGYEGLVYPFQI